jgi:hypothetical protein
MSDIKQIIGIASQFAGGKDTIANYLVKKLNNEVEGIHDFGLGPPKWSRVGFADAVKRVFMDTFGVDWDFIETWKRKDEIPPGFNQNVRKSLQFIGDGFRQIQSDIWIKTALKRDKIILSDVRYINEAKIIKESGGIVVVVWRKGHENDDPNPSESQIRPIIDWCVENCSDGIINYRGDEPENIQYYDFFLKNDGTLEDLYKKIDTFLLSYLRYKGVA